MRHALRLLRKRAVQLMLALCAMFLSVFGGYGVEQAVEVRADAQTGIILPVLMYHSVLKDPQRAGKFVVSPEVFEQDLQCLKDNGFTSIFVEDLIRYTQGGSSLPLRPVLITLDDGYYNNLMYVLPILEKLDMKAVISVVGEYAEEYSETQDKNPNYGYLSWDDIQTLINSGHVEIQNHSYALHTDQDGREGSMRKAGESLAEYERVFCEDTQRMQELLLSHCGFAPAAYTYPYGAVTEETTLYLQKMGFRASFSCYKHLNTITRDSACLFRLGRFNRPSGEDSEAFLARVLEG